MNFTKTITGLALALISLAGAMECMWIVGTKPAPSPSENLLVGIILFLASSVFAIIVAQYYARMSTFEKIDTIAERSAERLINLTTQIEGLALYLEETPNLADEEPNAFAALSTYRHRSQGAVLLARSLSSSNDVFSSDWIGVASPATAAKIQQRFNELRARAEATSKYEELRQYIGQMGDSQSANSQQLRSKLQDLRDRLDAPAANLPQVPRIGLPGQKASEVTQVTESYTDSQQRGKIHIRLLRPLKSVIGTGKLQPEMVSPPRMTIKLVECPPELDRNDFEYRCATGTKHDFPVYMKCRTQGHQLPPGDYWFEFTAISYGTGEHHGTDEA